MRERPSNWPSNDELAAFFESDSENVLQSQGAIDVASWGDFSGLIARLRSGAYLTRKERICIAKILSGDHSVIKGSRPTSLNKRARNARMALDYRQAVLKFGDKKTKREIRLAVAKKHGMKSDKAVKRAVNQQETRRAKKSPPAKQASKYRNAVYFG